jgi:hypothetical protein
LARSVSAAAAFLIIRIVEVMDGHDNEIALILVRERLKESIIDDAEDGSGSSDAKGEGKDWQRTRSGNLSLSRETQTESPL